MPRLWQARSSTSAHPTDLVVGCRYRAGFLEKANPGES